MSQPITQAIHQQWLVDAQAVAMEQGRSFISRRIDEALADHQVTGRQHALLELRIGVASGVPAGDPAQLAALSVMVAAHLHPLIPAHASLACLDSLRFAVILPLTGSFEEAETVVTDLFAALPISLMRGTSPIQIQVSAGMAILPTDGNRAAELLAAVAAVSGTGLATSADPLQFVACRLNQARLSQRELQFDLGQALAQNQFHVVFQPLVHLSTGNVIGFEAMLCWQHPLRGAIAPAEFLPVIERCGMAGALTRWMLEHSAAQLRVWEDLGHRGLQMTIHTPPSVFENTETTDFLLELLRRHEIACNQIEFEATERAFTAAHPDVLVRLQALRERGISVSMGDFGTGSSNLTSLTRLPLNCLKLDLGLARGATSNPAVAMLSRMSCVLARALKLRVAIDGVETEGQRTFFSQLGVELVQGPLFSHPLEAAEATALLQSKRLFARTQPPKGAARHLLLLDDEPNILRSLRRAFRAAGHTVHTANTPDEAFELLARHPVGVVMSDQRMPLMRGTEFLARVKQLYPDTMRIVLSGYTELQSVTEAINQGAIYKFLTKPWNDIELNEEIEQAFRQYEMVTEGHLLKRRLHDSNHALQSRLDQNEERLQREQVALNVSHEALGVVPVPILGIDASGMIAISNAAADQVLGCGLSVVGEHVDDVLPLDGADSCLDASCNRLRVVRIGEVMYEVRCNALGANSLGAGTVITLLQGAST